MHPFKRAARLSCAIVTAAVAIVSGSLSVRAAEPLSVEGGQIADAAPDASGIRIFKSIPYAAPPLGELRWRAPQPLQNWQGVRDVAEWGPRCVQSKRLGDLDPLNKRMDEDCLYLNIFTPAKLADEKLPVMVWIHGGSNLNGAGSSPNLTAPIWRETEWWSRASTTGSTSSASLRIRSLRRSRERTRLAITACSIKLPR